MATELFDIRRMPTEPRQDEQQFAPLLRRWLWLWPGMTVLAFAWAYVDPAAFRKCPQVYWVMSLIGLTTAGWSWLRTYDRRYLPPAIVSAGLFGVGVWIFWTLR
jgi:hypothetical protein